MRPDLALNWQAAEIYISDDSIKGKQTMIIFGHSHNTGV